LGYAVEHARARPLACVGGQAGQAQHGVGDAEALAAAAADPQRVCEAGPGAIGIAVLAPHPAQVDGHGVAVLPVRPRGLSRRFQANPRGGDVPDAERVHAGVVVQDAGEQLVAGSLSAGDGLIEQFPGPDRVDFVDAQQVSRQGLGEQDVIAQRPGPVDGFGAERQAALGLAGEVAGGAQDRQGPDEQGILVYLAGDLDRLFAVPLRRPNVGDARDTRGHHQGLAEQRRVRPGVGPLEDRPEQVQRLAAPAAPGPVPVQGHGEAQDLLGPARDAGDISGRAAQVRLIGIQPGEPVALAGPPQMRSSRLGDG
jgi:hypothetical protein